MPTSAHAEAWSLLRAVGYEDDWVERQYPVWLGSELGLTVADGVAFGRSEPHDMSTATIAVEARSIDLGLEIVRTLGAPYLLLNNNSHLELWVATAQEPVRWKDRITSDDLEELATWLRPSAALTAKVGLRQLPLIDVPVNLLAAAKNRGADRLGPIVGEALVAANQALPRSRAADPGVASRREHRRAARLVVSALTTLVMRDRAELREQTTEELLSRVSSMYPSTYGWLHRASKPEQSVLRELLDQLGKGIDYSSLDPSLLSLVYEESLVSENDRRNLGIHYTPPRLAARILEDLPVELIAPSERSILDPACGSGTLLVASHDRLRELQPVRWSESKRHEDLALSLHGTDVDPFAVEIARLTLLLHATPAGNGWRIDEGDTLRTNPLAADSSIIVSNPPWRYTSAGGERRQLASDFVRWSASALKPGGLLAIILPESWVSADHSREVREELQDACDIFEILHLPEDTFESSGMASCVLICRKSDGTGGGGFRLVKDVHAKDLDRYLDGGPPSLSFVHNEADLAAKVPLPQVESRTRPLSDLATVLSGQQPRPGIRDGSGSTLYLDHFRDVAAYGRVQSQVLWRVNFPADFQTSRGERILDKKKVLVSAARSSKNPWRFRVAIDTIGIAARNSVRGVAPIDQSDEDLLYAIALLVGSGFASTYAAALGADRNIPAGVLKTLPVPVAQRSLAALAERGRKATDLVDQGDFEALSKLLAESETVVWNALGVSAADQELAIRRLAGHTAIDGTDRYPNVERVRASSSSTFRRFGSVLSVDGQSVQLWVNGLTPDSGTTVTVPLDIPGWLVRPGATFDVVGADSPDDLQVARYQVQTMAWSDLDYDSEVPKPFDLQLVREASEVE